jgi:hypothetical protein
MNSTPFVPYDRVLVLALDSVCWEVLLPLAEDGTMPALASFLKGASYGVLESTIPPHTAAAWTTWLTGKDPGQHGVIDFVRFDPAKHRFRFHDSSVQRDSSMLNILSKAGVRLHFPAAQLPALPSRKRLHRQRLRNAQCQKPLHRTGRPSRRYFKCVSQLAFQFRRRLGRRCGRRGVFA